MNRSVDVAIAGADEAAIVETIDAARSGMRVLVVLRSNCARIVRRLRRAIRAAGVMASRVTIVTGAEIACVDGVNAVEAIVVRRITTGQLLAFNTSSVIRLDMPALRKEEIQ